MIPALNEETVIGQCLESLTRSTLRKQDFEVIVVDNGSTDRTREIAQSFSKFLSLRVLRMDDLHISALRNRGASAARGKFLAFLDADCIAPSEWLPLATAMFGAPNIGIIGGFCRIPENAPWVPRTWYADRQQEKRGEVSYVPAANLMISRPDFLRIGGFDESLETNEECELCERARSFGLKVTAHPELGVVHLRDPQTVGAFYRKQAWHGKNTLRVFFRNLPRMVNVRPISIAVYTLAGLTASAVCLSLGKLGWFAVLLGLACAPCVFLSGRIAIRRRRWRDVPGLFVLHLVYALARISALLDIRNWRSQGEKTTDRVQPARL